MQQPHHRTASKDGNDAAARDNVAAHHEGKGPRHPDVQSTHAHNVAEFGAPVSTNS